MIFRSQIVYLILLLFQIYFLWDTIKNKKYKDILSGGITNITYYALSIISGIVLTFGFLGLFTNADDGLYIFFLILWLLAIVFLKKVKNKSNEDYYFIISIGNLWIVEGLVLLKYKGEYFTDFLGLVVGIITLKTWILMGHSREKSTGMLTKNNQDAMCLFYIGISVITIIIGILLLFIFKLITFNTVDLMISILLGLLSFSFIRIDGEIERGRIVRKILQFFAIIYITSFLMKMLLY